jgi:type IX secretion system PorP/SprF family membrane protein
MKRKILRNITTFFGQNSVPQFFNTFVNAFAYFVLFVKIEINLKGSMTKVLKLSLLIIIVLLSTIKSFAQDPEFSQFYASPLHLNPALAGISYGPRVNLIYRNQWPSIDKGYVTYAASYDQHIEKIRGGIGVAIHSDRIAGGIVQNFAAQAMYSYQVAFSRKFGIKMALSGGVANKRLDFNSLTFQDQINPIYGFTDAIGTPNTSGEFPLQNNSIFYADFGGGLLAFTPKFYAGVGIKHFTRPQESFTGSDNRLPIRLAMHGGYVFDLTPKKKKDDIYLSPNILLVQQSNFSQLNIGTYFNYNFIYTGAFYRNTFRNSDAVIALLGFKIEYVRIAYSFDIPLNGLGINSGGAHEVTFTFNWGGDNNSLAPKGRNYKLDCPRMLSF